MKPRTVATPMKTFHDSPAAAARCRQWDRLGLGIRCAYNPQQPLVIRRYLALGAGLAQTGWMPSCEVYQRMSRLLLQTAGDEALPWFWRSVCLEHIALPLARLTSALKRDDPETVAALQADVQAAHDAMAGGPADLRTRVPAAGRR